MLDTLNEERKGPEGKRYVVGGVLRLEGAKTMEGEEILVGQMGPRGTQRGYLAGTTFPPPSHAAIYKRGSGFF